MTAEISSPRTLTPPTPVVRPNAAVEQAIKLLQPLDSLLAVGESANAEVIALKEVAQSFQLVLKLTLANGQQSTVQASSNQPLAQGTALAVTALSPTRLSIALLAPQVPLQSLDLEQLPLGTLL
ncbi:MAG: flagellar hook-length control protein FliK, partial [Pseudomonadaceae bacterium]|nr:flagellar hook-length control protein FliK [Pseudomonadaceae bacterium]